MSNKGELAKIFISATTTQQRNSAHHYMAEISARHLQAP
jgi:hypothetical protein